MSTIINDIDKIKQYLDFGMHLSVTVLFSSKDKCKLPCHLIGIKDKQFLLLDINQKSVESLITRKTNDVDIIVRGVADTDLGHIIAFKSQIITVTSRPAWLMFIQFPYHFETKPIRINKRFKLNVPVIVGHNGRETRAVLQDLSASGCGIHFDHTTELSKESQITIKPELEYFPQSTPVCHIVNIRKHSSGTFVGIKFETDINIEGKFKYEVLEQSLLS